MTYEQTRQAVARSTRTGRAAQFRLAGFTPRQADQLAAHHHLHNARIATTPAEMVGWNIRVIAC